MATPESIEPVPETERIAVIDILRGFALLGILVVNMAVYSFPITAVNTGTVRGDSPLDRIADVVIAGLATFKFYPLFSFLFGLGMSIQMLRIRQRGERAGWTLLRRQLVLMLIGLAHALLLWSADILFLYSLIGLAALLFRNVQPRTLSIWIPILYIIPFVFGLMAILLALAIGGTSVANRTAEPFGSSFSFAHLETRAIETYRDGTFLQIFVWRAIEWVIVLLSNVLTAGPQILALFLLGMYFGKRDIFQNLSDHQTLFRRGLVLGIAIGLPVNLVLAWLMQDRSSVWSLISPTVLPTLGPILTFGYVSALVLLAQKEPWRKPLKPLAAAGRMALTNYLMQSVICTFLFYSYGLRLYGSVGAAAGLVLSVSIWLVQLPISMLWLGKFRFGPMEWLWRSLTYGKAQPMKPTVELN
jgi:uncharacterized protein